MDPCDLRDCSVTVDRLREYAISHPFQADLYLKAVRLIEWLAWDNQRLERERNLWRDDVKHPQDARTNTKERSLNDAGTQPQD